MRRVAAIALVGALGFWGGDAKAACDPGKLNGAGTCDCPGGYKSTGDPGKARCMPASESGKGGNNFTVVSKCKPGNLDDCKKQCEFKNYGSCIVLGRMYKEGNGVSVADDEEAFKYFHKACDGGDLLGCVEEGRMHELGKGTSKNVDKAIKLYGKACDGKKPEGCRELAGNYFYGDGVAKDTSKALDLYEKACTQKDWYACNRIGLVYYDSLGGVAPDETKADKYFQKACDGGEGVACVNLAGAYDDGRGVPKDHQKSLVLMEKACTSGYGSGCNTMGLKYTKGVDFPKDWNKAYTYFEKACSLGEKWGCNNAAYCQEKGQGTTKDEKTAAARYDKACAMGAWDACDSVADMYFDGRGVSQDDVKTASYYKKACDLGDQAKSCRGYGFLLWSGRGVTKDHATSVKYSHKGCEGGDNTGCHNEAYAYELGDGVPKDVAKARTLYTKACKNGYQDSCDSLKKLAGASGTVTSTGGLVGIFVPSKRDVVFLSSGDTSSFLQKAMPTSSTIASDTAAINGKSGDFRWTKTGNKRLVIVVQQSGSRKGTVLDVSANGYPILPLDTFEKTVVPTNVAESTLKQWYDAVSRHLAQSGDCKSMIVFANGNAAEVRWTLSTDGKLTWDAKLFKAGAWSKAGYSPIIEGPEDADSFTNDGKHEKYAL